MRGPDASPRFPGPAIVEKFFEVFDALRGEGGCRESAGDSESLQDTIRCAGWDGRPAWMAKPYSMDLRERVVQAVTEEGYSRRGAAERFGIGVTTVITWMRRWHDSGSVAAGKMGGHKPKKLTGEWRDWLLHRCRERGFTLRGLVGELAERGLKVDYRSVWAFVHAEKLTFKKRR
jgi:putative transposase